jgi:hypothetical protein
VSLAEEPDVTVSETAATDESLTEEASAITLHGTLVRVITEASSNAVALVFFIKKLLSILNFAAS